MAVAVASFSTIVTRSPRTGCGDGGATAGGVPGGKRPRSSRSRCTAVRAVTAAQSDDDVVSRVVRPIEVPDIVQRDRLDRLHGAGGQVAVGRAGEDLLVQHRLAQLFVAGIAEHVLQVVQHVALQAVEILLLEGRRQRRLDEQRVVVLQVVPVDAPEMTVISAVTDDE